MNAEQVIDHFERICDAPDAIPRLRQFILELAVRGKLVDQDPRDEHASKLLKRIQVEKERRILEGQMREQEALSEVHSEERWFEIPASWQWVRLGAIAQILMGQSPKGESYNKTGEGIPLINGPVEFTEGPFGKTVINQYTTAPTNICEEGDLLLCVRGSTTGRTNVAGFRACIGRGVAAIRPFFAGQYVRLFVWRLRAAIIAMGRGIAFPSVSRQQIEELPVPLPPLGEQNRIVVKVDELMAICDRLEAVQAERENRRDKLTAASLHRLNNGADVEEFREHARFHLRHLPRLTTRPEHIQQLRQTILNLAVRGKLVPQDPNDEPGSELLERIQIEKERLIREGLIRKEKPLSPVTEEDAPFSIPRSWSWVRIGTCALLTDYGTSVKSDHIDNGVPVLKMGDIRDGNVLMGGQKKVPPSIDDLPQLFLKRFDLLYNRTNSAELVGKTGIYLGEDDAYTFASYLIRIRFFNDRMSPVYCNLAMNASYFRATQIVPELQQQCGQANVNGTKLRNMVLPIPPAAEQHRIVAKIDELLAICDRLEAQLTGSQKESRCFLEAVLARSLE
jgi:type I restriction enzyme, S subunit